MEKGEDSERFQNLASRSVCAAMTVSAQDHRRSLRRSEEVTESAAASATFAAGALTMFVGFLVPLPDVARAGQEPGP